MLERDLERIAQKLSSGIVAALREASVDELAELIPSIRKLVKELERPRPAAVTAAPAASKGSSPSKGAAPKASGRSGRGQVAPRSTRGAQVPLVDRVLDLLSERPSGLRSEEIQQELSAGSADVRLALATLLEAGQVARKGQARGTRYSLPDGGASASPPSPPSPPPPSSRREPTPPSPKPVREPREPKEAREVPPIEVKVETINDIRAHLANTVVPMTLSELEEVSKLERATLKAVLDRMVEMSLIEREGHGPALRYRLATPSSGDTHGGESNGPARIVRRPPRAKTWQPQAETPQPPAAGEAADVGSS